MISSSDIEQAKPIITRVAPIAEPVKALETNADINLGQQAKKETPPLVITPVATVPPIKSVVITPPQPQKQEKTKPEPKKLHANLTNSLLGQLGNPVNIGKSRGKTLGGIQAGTSNTNLMVNNYANQVISAVRPFVDVPDGINSLATAIVQVRLLPNMSVYKVQLKQSSGNSVYDNSIQDAIRKVAVFPQLPDGAKFSDFSVLYLTFRPD
ncbi:MAG: TonB family protein [Burkholderiales bacterium]|nr:TonB family protein [Burkholderiales bacterium]